ncbi:MAG: histidine kinase [Deltaproteobacteria bacterium]|nr:histidine kinase [Deltaproteobacteria bacterium]
MELASSTFSKLNRTLHREALVCLVVGAPILGYVLATNHTASLPVILLHATLLGALTPLSVSVLEWAVPRAAHPGWRGALRDVGIRMLGLCLAVLGTLVLIAALTPLSLSVLVGGPLLVGLVPVFLSYALVAMGVQWAGLREHALRAEANEARARQAALAARIRPHFLFNALNCIEELTDTDPPAARLAVGRLARLLHSVLLSSANPVARLGDEVRLVDDYLGLEQIRFGARLAYELSVKPEAANLELPTTVLLTLAENAVKHGLEATRGPARIVLRAWIQDDLLRIILSGPALPAAAPRPEQGTGYGLHDVRERLQLTYAGRASFALRFAEGESHAELVLPC